LRLAFRVRSNKTEYDLTAENKVRSAEDKNFADDGSKQQGGYTDEVRTNLVAFTGNYSVALKQGGRGTQTHRIFKKIPIKAGTKLSMAVVAKYIPLDKEGVVSLQSATTKKSDLATLSAVAAPLLSLSTQQIGTEAAPTPVANLNVLAVVPFIKKLFSKPTPVVTESPTILFSGSMAGMRFRFDDKNGSYTHSHVSSLSTARPTEWTQLGLSYVAADDGVLEVEIFNYNTDLPVFFDDWHIELTEDSKPEIVQEVHYDPWGLVMEDESYFASVSPANGADLFNGKELQTYADLNFYDYHWRQYDPQLGRWHSPDPADQFYGISGYAYCANNPVMLTDPDGREIVLGTILIAAAIGGIINTATHWGQITAGGGFNWSVAGAAFGIGAAGGAITAATGGAAAGAMGFTSTGFISGFVTGGIGEIVGSPVKGLLNMAYFGDSYSWGQYGRDILMAAGIGGTLAGIGALLKGQNFWTGVPRSTTGGAFDFDDTDDAILDGWKKIKDDDGVWTWKKEIIEVGEPYMALKQDSWNFQPNEFNPAKTLYRGTTGSELDGNPFLYLAEDPEYARGYILNGGKLVKVNIPIQTFEELRIRRLLEIIPHGINSVTGQKGVEILIRDANLKKTLVNMFQDVK